MFTQPSVTVSLLPVSCNSQRQVLSVDCIIRKNLYEIGCNQTTTESKQEFI